MTFDILRSYTEAAGLYKGNYIETDELALKVRNSSPRGWVKVRNNNHTQWPGEKLEFRKNKEGKDELWSYRCLDKFDFVLYSLLIDRFKESIIHTYIKKELYKYGDDFQWCEFVEPWFNQTIRHFDPNGEAVRVNLKKHTVIKAKKRISFKSLWITMLNNCAANFVNQYNTQHVKIDKETGVRVKDENGIVIKNIEYRSPIMSLNQITEDKSNPYFYTLPKVGGLEYDCIEELKDKYKKEKDLITWITLDLEAKESILLGEPKLFKILEANKQIRSRKQSLYNIYKGIIDKKLNIKYGFVYTPSIATKEKNKEKDDNKEKKNDKVIEAMLKEGGLTMNQFNKVFDRTIRLLTKEAQDLELSL